jgi:hypothetical protein
MKNINGHISETIWDNILKPIRMSMGYLSIKFRTNNIEGQLYEIFNNRIERIIDLNFYNGTSPHKQKANEE